MDIKERFLPIGTVVVLNGGSKKVMITGFCSVAEDSPDKMWDYRGCPYPEGVLASEGVALFDHSQIQEVVHIGFENPESIDMSDKLNIILEQRTNKDTE